MVLAAVVLASVSIVRLITGSHESALLNLVLVVPITATLALLTNVVRRRFRQASPRTRRRIAVGGWLIAMALIIGSDALNLAWGGNPLEAAVFVVVMSLLVWALWEYFPGDPRA